MKRSVVAIGLVLVLLVTAVGTLSAADEVLWKWQQPPDPVGWDVDLLYTTLADDWLCDESGRIDDITFWVSWNDDDDLWDAVRSFRLIIYDDIPAGERAEWSMPGSKLWWMTVRPGEFTVTEVPNRDRWQGWIEPVPERYYANDHQRYWRVDVNDIGKILKQQGGGKVPFAQKEGTTYWLGIETYLGYKGASPDGGYIGWKTTRPRLGWGDNAVYFYDYDGGPRWHPLWLPESENPLNLAFELTNRAAQQPPECIMHVQDIRGSVQDSRSGLGGYELRARVLVQDANGAPLEGVQVKARVTVPVDSTSAQQSNTDSTGWANFTAASQQAGTWTLRVMDLVKEGCTYDAGANVRSSKTWDNGNK